MLIRVSLDRSEIIVSMASIGANMATSASEDNGRKSKKGFSGKKALRKVIEELEDYGALAGSITAPEYGYDGYDQSQFKAHEEVSYPDESKAILYITSSLRSDRLQEDQWRAHNIKRIDPDVTYAYVILPDESGYDQGTSPRDQIREGRVVTAIDDVITLQEFYDRTIANYSESLESGASHDLQGRRLETLFAKILADVENLQRYNGSATETGYMYDAYLRVMKKLGVSSGELCDVETTTDIPALPSGGNPKTDIAAKIKLRDGSIIVATFSLKNTSHKSVSVHEYSADDFADVLDPENNELRRLLNVFQATGNKRDMDDADVQALTDELSPYLRKLNRWVFSGEGAPGVDELQIAQYMIVRDKNTGKLSIHSVDEYITKQEAEIDGSNWFGTIFSWTYPSKKRGKKIQLKAHIVH